MALKRIADRPAGYTPGKDFTDFTGIKLGMITRVDEINMKADVKILTGVGERFEIDLTQGMCGPRSFWGGCPEVNSMVIIGYRRKHKNLTDAMILGYLPVGNRSGLKFDPVAPADPNEVLGVDKDLLAKLIGATTRYKRLKLKCGDVGGMSSAGSEFVLSKDVRMANRAGDLFELRDSDRTLISQAIHRIEADAGVRRIAGPIRRGGFYLPDDIFKDETLLRGESDDPPYFGQDELQAAGPGTVVGSGLKWADTTGKPNEVFNEFDEFPPVVYSNGRRVHYVPTSPAVSIENPDAGADAFVEDRFEMSHTSDLSQEVLEEIDGYNAEQRAPYIERVLGTVVGNDLLSTKGQRQYARVLKPKLFPNFTSNRIAKFSMEECDRKVTAPDLEVQTQAGAFLFRIRKPRGTGNNEFVAAVSKQGKLFLNLPGSEFEDDPSGTKNVSAEINCAGALKAFFGAAAPSRLSAHITCEGGVFLDIGRAANGKAVDLKFHSGCATEYDGNPDENDMAKSEIIRGLKASTISGAELKFIEGAKKTQVSGQLMERCDRREIAAFSGYSLTAGEKNETISGKSQLQYALAVIENIITGGKVSTILAGAKATTVAAGAMSYTVAAGATSFNSPAGAFNIVVGTGSLSQTVASGAVALSTAAGAMALSAAAGAVAITAGPNVSITGANTLVTSALINLGGPTAVLGVTRGIPTFPPGVPTLDYITGLPLLGSLGVLAN